MTRRTNYLKLGAFALGLAVSSASMSADPLIASCDSCHSPDKKDVPVISGVSAYALESSLIAYTDGSRIARTYENQDMKAIVEALSKDDMNKILDTYPARAFTPIKQSVDPAAAKAGERIHLAQCEKCHTENGALADDDSGILAGQWKGYLVEEMQQYRSGQRKGDKKMVDALKALSDADIQNLAEFYASQQ